MTSQIKKFGVLIDISANSAKELAHKGWHNHVNDFSLGGNDNSENYLEDELSISLTSSPDTTDIIKNEVKTLREAETTLNFDDCLVKTSNVLHATVGHSISIKPNQADNVSYFNTTFNPINTENGFTKDRMPKVDPESVVHEEELVYETPNANLCWSHERFQNLLDVNQYDSEEETKRSSQEYALNSPPQQFQVNKTSTGDEIVEKISSYKNAVSSPICKDREHTLPITEPTTNKSLNVHSSRKLIPIKLFANEGNSDSIHERNEKLNLYNEYNVNILNKAIYLNENSSDPEISEFVGSPENDCSSRFHSSSISKNLTPVETYKQLASPILGSNKKRHLRSLKKSAKKKSRACTEGRSHSPQYQENTLSTHNMKNNNIGMKDLLICSGHLDKLDKSGEDLISSGKVPNDRNILHTPDNFISIHENTEHMDDELRLSLFSPFGELTPTKTDQITSSPVFGSKQKKISKGKESMNRNNGPYAAEKKTHVLAKNYSSCTAEGYVNADLTTSITCLRDPDVAIAPKTFDVDANLIHDLPCYTPDLIPHSQNASNRVQLQEKLKDVSNVHLNLVSMNRTEIQENINGNSLINSCEGSENLSPSTLEHLESSPVLGSKRKRSVKNNKKRVKQNLNFVLSEEPGDLFHNNKENTPCKNEDSVLPLIEEDSVMVNNIDVTNTILPLSELQTDEIASTNLESQNHLLLNRADRSDSICEVDKDSSSNTIAFNKRRTCKRKLELQYSQSIWNQIFVTQKSLTLSCVEDFRNQDMNSNTYKDIFPFQNMVDLNRNFYKKNVSHTTPSLNSTIASKQNDVNDCQAGNIELCDVSEKSVLNSHVNLDLHLLLEDATSGLRRDDVDGTSKQNITEMSISDASQEAVKKNIEKDFSQNSISDVVECSQILTNPKFRRRTNLITDNKVTSLSPYNKNVNDNFSSNKETISANVQLFYAKKKVDTILNESAYIENPSSEDESMPSLDKNIIIEEQVSQTVGFERRNLNRNYAKRKLETRKEFNVQTTFPSLPNCSKMTDTIPPISNTCGILEDNEIMNISVASPEAPALLQETSPSKKMISQDVQIHISSGSSLDAERGNVTPPRKTSPVNIDSGKKRKRLKKDGLAARLQRLLAHKQASAHLCKYELSACIRQPGDSIFLIKKAWLEFNHMLLLCFSCTSVSPLQVDVTGNEGTTSKNTRSPIKENKNMNSLWVIVLGTNIVPIGLIKENTLIRIYAPWQTMYVPRLEITLLLNVTHAELLHDNTQVDVPQSPPIVYKEDVFQFPYLLAAGRSKKNSDYKMPNQGSEIMKLMFPILNDESNVHNPVKLLEVVPVKSDCKSGTIEEVTKCTDSTDSNNFLVLKICKIFCYRNSKTDSNNENIIWSADESNLIWSVLGVDMNDEQCEIILGSPYENENSNEWINIIKNVALENVYKFNNVSLVKRMLQCGNDCPPISKHQQMFFFVFSVTSGTWHLEKEVLDGDCPSPRLNVLLDIFLRKTCSNRLSVLAKPLFVWENILYVTDFSLSSCEDEEICKYLKVNVNSSCYIPAEILTHVILLQDILLLKDNLYTDKYCRVYDAETEDERKCLIFDEKDVIINKNINIQIPTLDVSCQNEDLVSIKGAIIEVDESTALVWPVCKQCDGDLIEQPYHHQLLCEHCGVTEPIMKVSLEVIIQDASSNICVKVKLLQRTILSLLPGALGETDFEVESVIQKPIGPLVCIILNKTSSKLIKSSSYKMLLQEIDLF